MYLYAGAVDETADRILDAAFAWIVEHGLRRTTAVYRFLTETTLPRPTPEAGPYLKVAREHLTGHLRGPESEAVAEVFIRVTLSFLLTPDSVVPLSSDEEARAFAARHLVPLLP
ncbi:hypothetical protein ACIBHY_27365 [Nonomuraea sp. NPDC050547]|uniref:hypothetical protein n=1 Tax=Nonomuraea sp. NPDC050547 TaxID=3364368 RepID=UPI0037A84188